MKILSTTTTAFLFLVSRSVYGFPADPNYHHLAPRQSGLSFAPCYSDGLECARYEPPLDYANAAAGKASLAVIRFKATKQPRLGTIFTNPGGPSASGVDFLTRSGRLLSNTTGGYFDIVSWDPRGVNNSYPKINCFTSGTEEATFWGDAMPWVGLETMGNFTYGPDFDVIYAKVNDTDTKLGQLGERCTLLSGNNLTYVGSVASVRDLVAMADLFDGPSAPINYWGFSYGTLIGSYLINMFPTRVGRVVLDGLEDPTAYSVNPPHKARAGDLQSAEAVFSAFSDQCAKAGPKCVINDGTNSAPAVAGYVWTLVNAVYDAHKLGFPYGSQAIRDFVFSYMYTPRYWEELAGQLRLVAIDLQNFAAALASATPGAPVATGFIQVGPGKPSSLTSFDSSNFESLTQQTVLQRVDMWQTSSLGDPSTKGHHRIPTKTSQSLKGMRDRGKQNVAGDLIDMMQETRRANHIKRQQNDAPRDYSIIAITCGDAIDAGAVTTRDVVDEIVRTSAQVSAIFGASWTSAGYWCHRWPTRSVERYKGPFTAKLANPILVIANQYDPITPFANARTVSDALGDFAVLISQDGWGHTSGSMHSECTIGYVANYFIAGLVPTSDKFCGTDQAIFSGSEPNSVNLVTSVSPVVSGTVVITPGVTATGGVINSTDLNGARSLRERLPPPYIWAAFCIITGYLLV